MIDGNGFGKTSIEELKSMLDEMRLRTPFRFLVMVFVLVLVCL
jgi:hypothetical protein